jgi:hypothetical protein
MGQFADICLAILGITLLVVPFFVIPKMMKKMERNPDIRTRDSGGHDAGI